MGSKNGSWLFWGPKMDCKGTFNAHTMFYIDRFILHMQKNMGFENFQLHYLPKKKNTKHFSNLSSSNAHIKTNTCPKCMLSPNNLKFKLIIILEKINHIYSMVEIKTLKRAKLCLAIESQRFIKP